MKQMYNNKNQKGFSILAVILVIVAVIVAIGIWALSGQTNTSNYTNTSSDVQASSLINDSSIIKAEFDTIIINGGNPNVITDATSVFYRNTVNSSNNTTDYSLNFQKPNSKIIYLNPSFTDEGYWIFGTYSNRNSTVGTIRGNNIGTSAYDDGIIVAGIKQDTCKEINRILNGTTVIPMTDNNSILFSGGRNPVFQTLNFTTINETSGWMSGCVGTLRGTDSNIFFRILQPN